MRTRVLVGILILVGLAGLFWLDHYWWNGYCICIAGIFVTGVALIEFYMMSRNCGAHPFSRIGVGFGVLLLPYFAWMENVPKSDIGDASSFLMVAPLVLLIPAVMIQALRRKEGLAPQLLNVSVTVFGVLYIALPMAFLIRTRFIQPDGWILVLLIIAVSKASDIGGYLVGHTLGRHKLAPRVSPNKTIEGAIGGLLFSAAASALLCRFLNINVLIDYGFWATIGFGAAIGAASQASDLTESLIKRSAGVKDSGVLLPSFGGMLDLIDSFVIAAPLGYFILSALAKQVSS